MKIDTKTQLCGLIGNPVSHSLSPAIHNAAFEVMGLNYVYLAFRVIDCKGAIEGMRAFEQLKGLSVTIPHKISVMKYLDWVDDVAIKIGSVNTIVKEENRLRGYNTDAIGSIKAIRESGTQISGRDILMLGSGGVARAVAFSLLMEEEPPSSLSILGIEKLELERLVNELNSLGKCTVTGNEPVEDQMSKKIEMAKILVNCTPVGMWPEIEKSLVPAGFLHADLTVFDVIYNPLETRLIKDAKEKGCKVIPGLDMFIYQAVGQFEFWTKQKAPVNVMREKVLESLQKG